MWHRIPFIVLCIIAIVISSAYADACDNTSLEVSLFIGPQTDSVSSSIISHTVRCTYRIIDPRIHTVICNAVNANVVSHDELLSSACDLQSDDVYHVTVSNSVPYSFVILTALDQQGEYLDSILFLLIPQQDGSLHWEQIE